MKWWGWLLLGMVTGVTGGVAVALYLRLQQSQQQLDEAQQNLVALEDSLDTNRRTLDSLKLNFHKDTVWLTRWQTRWDTLKTETFTPIPILIATADSTIQACRRALSSCATRADSTEQQLKRSQSRVDWLTAELRKEQKPCRFLGMSCSTATLLGGVVLGVGLSQLP